MVTKQDIWNHYAENRKDSNVGMCPATIKDYLDTMVEDENGIYALSSQLLSGDHEYYTLEMVKDAIRRDIAQCIKDLQRIAEI
jgi:hypothetical protein